MGFMDKFKDMAGQAEGAMQQGMSPATAGEAERINRIGQQGVETPAVLKGLTPVGSKQIGGGTEYELDLEVRPVGREPYPATIRQQLIDETVAGYEGKIGEEVVVKVDPNDSNEIVLWG